MTQRYSKEFQKIFNFTRLFSEMCGADVIKDDYHMTWVTWCVVILINVATIFTFYTIYVGVVYDNDLTVILKCLCMFCTGMQGYSKLINVITRPHIYSSLYKELYALYDSYEKKTKNYHKFLEESILLMKRLIGILLVIVLIVTAIIIFTPVFYKLVFNERIFIMPFRFPYIDYNTDLGYYITSSFHVMCIFFGAFGNFVSDMWCFLFAAQIPLIKNIFKLKLDELDELLENDLQGVKKIKISLKNIIIWHQTYIRFSNDVKDLFFWVIFVQVSMEFISIVCTIVCIFLGVWPAAPAFLFYSFVIFYAYSSLGNLVEISNDDVIVMIYDCCWYKLNASHQKMVLFMLRESQRAENMSIGGVAPLSLNTALQLTKTIYTFSMMLRQFLNN